MAFPASQAKSPPGSLKKGANMAPIPPLSPKSPRYGKKGQSAGIIPLPNAKVGKKGGPSLPKLTSLVYQVPKSAAKPKPKGK